MNNVIKIEDLSKKYILSQNSQKQSYLTLRDSITNIFTKKQTSSKEDFWALRDLNLDIKQGDRVGIIGNNGAGKSTLLKILSRITPPTTGRVGMKGRVASLLEVGTGFHAELTGRENIFLNGAIIGMSRAEIQRKFDQIVDFAGVEKFLDTPVKRYSSGMYVRLAFSVSAHLEPDILIVDEVLAVGDAQFQKKCLGKMDAAGKEGRTILFVSHNMGIVSQLCNTCAWLEKGTLKSIGPTDQIANDYLRNGSSLSGGRFNVQEDPKKNIQLTSVTLLNDTGIVTDKFSCDEPVSIRFNISVHTNVPGVYGCINVFKPDGTMVMLLDSNDSRANPLEHLSLGHNSFNVTIPARTLGHGEYLLHFSFASQAADNFHVDVPGNVCSFTLDDFTSKRGNQRTGYFSTLIPWENRNLSN
jgi:lipopolysaccharide transport system ATP-binding protein